MNQPSLFLKDKVEVTGNPVRFTVYPQPRKPTEPLQILVLGGSSGAHRLNLGVLKAFTICRDSVIKLNIVHQTGDADVAVVADGYRNLGREARVVAFIDDIAAALDRADLVIARSGAMTVSEIALGRTTGDIRPLPVPSRSPTRIERPRPRAPRCRAKLSSTTTISAKIWRPLLRELATDAAELVAMGSEGSGHAAHVDAAAKIAGICFGIVAQSECRTA